MTPKDRRRVILAMAKELSPGLWTAFTAGHKRERIAEAERALNVLLAIADVKMKDTPNAH